MARRGLLSAIAVVLTLPCVATGQTTAGIGTTIVFPVIAQTESFASEVTLFNPGTGPLTAHVTFFEANNSATPGTKVCTDANVPANRSGHFTIGAQCALAPGSHFGLLVVADAANPQTNAFYGYTRVQNPQGIGFSVEGFPVQNFNNQVSHATGLKRQAAAPTFQTNCFVGSLDKPVSYELKLFNDTTGAQIGGTLSGSLDAFEQFRYLDVFGANGVNAPAGDQFNVRAQFTQTSGGTANLIGFCTVQDNTSFGADFRIAKSFGSPSNSFFAQGGNTFGTVAKLGTLDNQPLEIYVAGLRAMRYEPQGGRPNIAGGHPNNTASGGGATVAGGGDFFDCSIAGSTRPCVNAATASGASVGGGYANIASGQFSVIAGGYLNTASGQGNTIGGGANSTTASAFWSTVGGGLGNTSSGNSSTVAGGFGNVASGSNSSVPGGSLNVASGAESFAAGHRAKATASGEFTWADNRNFDWDPGPSWGNNPTNTFNVRATGGVYFVTDISGSSGVPTVGCSLQPGFGSWTCSSSRDLKTDFERADTREVLRRVVSMPIERWRFKGESPDVRHMGPVAQDFRAAFGLGYDETSISGIDLDGVALAAIQGLHQTIQEKDARIAALEQSVEELRRVVEALAKRQWEAR